MTIIDFVLTHTQQGECHCGKCFTPEPSRMRSEQTGNHVVDMEFFKVAIIGAPLRADFAKLTDEHKAEFGNIDFHDAKEHSYTEVGGWIGDQGLALRFMALGAHLGVFELLTPNTMMPTLDAATKMMMAGAGYVAVVGINGRHASVEGAP